MSKQRKKTLNHATLTFLPTTRLSFAEKDDKADIVPEASRDGRDATKAVGASHSSATASSVGIQPSPVPAVCNRPMDSSFDLPDSTDWIQTTLPSFEPLEAALRCEICKEFYNNPVITTCHHTFCSICIRRCIAADGKCPSCMTVCSSDKLAPNIAIREVVMRFREARPKAMELARADKAETAAASKKKRKLDDTDMEDDDDNARHTRSRTTRSRGQRNGGAIVVADSEDDGDEDFVPDGIVKCPLCNKGMKEELVYNHLDVCKGPDESQGRNTRSRNSAAFPVALQRRQKDASPPPTRLSQFNYAMLKESALRKKLQEAGIPSWGTKDLMKRRHIEWLNIHNSNCDAEENLRKSKKQLLRELDEWEKTQGGRADVRENKIMKKDFDGQSYAKSNKSEFDELIARARQKRDTPKTNGEPSTVQSTHVGVESQSHHHVNPPNGTEISHQRNPSNHGSSTTLPPHPTHPYENNESALASIRAKVAEANLQSPKAPTLASEHSMENVQDHDPAIEEIQNPLGTPSRKRPMFALPKDPGLDVEGSTALQ